MTHGKRTRGKSVTSPRGRTAPSCKLLSLGSRLRAPCLFTTYVRTSLLGSAALVSCKETATSKAPSHGDATTVRGMWMEAGRRYNVLLRHECAVSGHDDKRRKGRRHGRKAKRAKRPHPFAAARRAGGTIIPAPLQRGAAWE